jgi:hypothetical protein
MALVQIKSITIKPIKAQSLVSLEPLKLELDKDPFRIQMQMEGTIPTTVTPLGRREKDC